MVCSKEDEDHLNNPFSNPSDVFCGFSFDLIELHSLVSARPMFSVFSINEPISTKTLSKGEMKRLR